jgi:hypothetical protein
VRSAAGSRAWYVGEYTAPGEIVAADFCTADDFSAGKVELVLTMARLDERAGRTASDELRASSRLLALAARRRFALVMASAVRKISSGLRTSIAARICERLNRSDGSGGAVPRYLAAAFASDVDIL